MNIRSRSERGAAIVEFAIVAPLLLMMVFGLVEFGRAYNANISVTHAAREGVREFAITRGSEDFDIARDAGIAAAVGAATSISIDPDDVVFTDCELGGPAVVVVTYPNFDFMIPFVPLPNIDLSARGVMRCGG